MHFNISNTLIVMFFLFLCSETQAQSDFLDNYIVEYLDVSKGLSNNYVTKIIEDKKKIFYR